MDIPGWLIATLAGAVVFGAGGFFIKYGTIRSKDSGAIVLFAMYSLATLCFMSLSLLQGTFTIQPGIILAGVVVGFGSVLGNAFWVQSFAYGPASLTGPVVNSYNILVILLSVLIFGEQLSLNEILGIGVLLIALSLINYDPDEALKIRHRRWYWLVLFAILAFFFRNGGLKITEELTFDNTLILGYAYAVGIFWFGRILLKTKQHQLDPHAGFALRWGFITGLCSFAGMQLFSIALATGPASIVSPVFAMNGLVFALMTLTLPGERLSRYQAVALAGCISALVLIRL